MTIDELFQIITDRKKQMPQKSYTADLFRAGKDRIIQKVGEEATEVIIAAKNNEKSQIVYESADLLFHLLVMLCEFDIKPEDIIEELGKRQKMK